MAVSQDTRHRRSVGELPSREPSCSAGVALQLSVLSGPWPIGPGSHPMTLRGPSRLLSVLSDSSSVGGRERSLRTFRVRGCCIPTARASLRGLGSQASRSAPSSSDLAASHSSSGWKCRDGSWMKLAWVSLTGYEPNDMVFNELVNSQGSFSTLPRHRTWT